MPDERHPFGGSFEPVDLGNPELNRSINHVLAAADDSPPTWWWLSFADGGFLGAVVCRGANMVAATQHAHELGINPGGQVLGYELSDELVEAQVPEEQRFKLLQKPDIEAMGWSTKTLAELEDEETET